MEKGDNTADLGRTCTGPMGGSADLEGAYCFGLEKGTSSQDPPRLVR